ncbi:MAG TPA: ABC transporter permease subunit [Candidatus Baltobacteraceae bacterium]|nr:ABC transporter permease subunit [Candidatus Baltobacteraceae bacterium]
MTYIGHHLGEIGELTLQHLALVCAGLALALAVAALLAWLVMRVPRIDTAIFAGAGIVYVIPSLALLAIAVRYLGLGFWPVVLILAAYAQFILVRGIVTALRTVSETQLDAARGLGMSPAQEFWRVRLPQATPLLIGTVRLATVALIAIATLGGYVGAGGLGNDIFLGLQRQFLEQTLAGSIPAAGLAVIVDAALRIAEGAAVRRIGS